jgi:hypothetical protein
VDLRFEREIFLRQTLFLPQLSQIPTETLAYVHLATVGVCRRTVYRRWVTSSLTSLPLRALLSVTYCRHEGGLEKAAVITKGEATASMPQWSWAGLDTMRVGRWGEMHLGMALTRAGLDVYQPMVDDRSIDLLVRVTSEPVRYLEVQVKTVRLSRASLSSYVFMKKRLFPLSSSRFLGLVVLVEGKDEPEMFLVPASVWSEPKAPFVSRDYVDRKSEPEYGISVAAGTLIALEPYRLESQLQGLRRT